MLCSVLHCRSCCFARCWWGWWGEGGPLRSACLGWGVPELQSALVLLPASQQCSIRGAQPGHCTSAHRSLGRLQHLTCFLALRSPLLWCLQAVPVRGALLGAQLPVLAQRPPADAHLRGDPACLHCLHCPPACLVACLHGTWPALSRWLLWAWLAFSGGTRAGRLMCGWLALPGRSSPLL